MDIEQLTPQMSSSFNINVDKAANYWACCRLQNATLTAEVAEIAEADFVTARQGQSQDQQHQQNAAASSSSLISGNSEDNQLQQADFSRWITVARLLAISEGSSTVEHSHWIHMRELEKARMDRL